MAHLQATVLLVQEHQVMVMAKRVLLVLLFLVIQQEQVGQLVTVGLQVVVTKVLQVVDSIQMAPMVGHIVLLLLEEIVI